MKLPRNSRETRTKKCKNSHLSAVSVFSSAILLNREKFETSSADLSKKSSWKLCWMSSRSVAAFGPAVRPDDRTEFRSLDTERAMRVLRLFVLRAAPPEVLRCWLAGLLAGLPAALRLRLRRDGALLYELPVTASAMSGGGANRS